MNQCANQTQLLSHTTGEFPGRPLAEFAHAGGVQQPSRARLPLIRLYTEQVPIEADVFVNRQVLVQAKALRHVTQIVFGGFRVVHNVRAGHGRRTLVGRHYARKHSQGRCLACPIRTNKSKNLSWINVERNAIDGTNTGKAFGQSAGRECGLYCRFHCAEVEPEFNGISASAGIPGLSSWLGFSTSILMR